MGHVAGMRVRHLTHVARVGYLTHVRVAPMSNRKGWQHLAAAIPTPPSP
jgi:hypothetical protein